MDKQLNKKIKFAMIFVVVIAFLMDFYRYQILKNYTLNASQNLMLAMPMIVMLVLLIIIKPNYHYILGIGFLLIFGYQLILQLVSFTHLITLDVNHTILIQSFSHMIRTIVVMVLLSIIFFRKKHFSTLILY